MKAFLAWVALLFAAVSCTSPASTETFMMKTAVGNTVVRIQKPEMKSFAKYPVVIICHGLTGNKDELHLISLADSLQHYGIASVRFDFNGHGESDTPFSGHTLANELDDLQVIFDYVKSLEWVDTGRIALSGHSQGGAVAGMKAGQLGEENIKCLALLAPAACIHTQALSGTFFGAELLDFESLPDSIPFWGGHFLGKEYIRVAREMDIHAITSAYTGPTCILQGDKDDSGLIVDALKYCDYMPQAEVMMREGYDHCYTLDPADAEIPAVRFLVEHLK